MPQTIRSEWVDTEISLECEAKLSMPKRVTSHVLLEKPVVFLFPPSFEGSVFWTLGCSEETR